MGPKVPPQEPVPIYDMARGPLVLEKLVICYFVAALVYFGIALIGGLIMALQLLNHNPLHGIEFFSAGRWRLVHTNAIAYGFLANSFLGILHWIVPRLTLRPVNTALSWFIFGAWQVVVVSTACGLVLGQAQGAGVGRDARLDRSARRGGADPGGDQLHDADPANSRADVRGVVVFHGDVRLDAAHLRDGQLPAAILHRRLGGWGADGLFIHDLVGLFVTPIGWGMMYYFVPILLKRPIWSHGLSLVGFWGLAFFYPLTGIHHFLYTPIPMFLQYGAVISTIAVEFVVTTVIINFFATVWGQGGEVVRQIPLRWYYTGMVFYFVTCLQCAMQATLTFQAIIHFTDWVVAHAHLVMFGVFSFWILGTMVYLFPRLLRRPWYSQALLEWHYWLSAIGLIVMFAALTIAGVFQGFSWASLDVWEESLVVSKPFWWTRLIAGLAIITGQVLFVVNLVLTARQPVPAEEEELAAVAS